MIFLTCAVVFLGKSLSRFSVNLDREILTTTLRKNISFF